MTGIDPRSLIKQRYGELSIVRDEYVDRSFDYAELTIPAIMPDNARHNDSKNPTYDEEMQHDYNTEGAKLVNNLANHYVSTLFPAGRSFAKLRLDEPDIKAQEALGRSKGQIDTAFSAVERDLRQLIEDAGLRDDMLTLLLNLIITGNGMPYVPPKDEGLIQVYALDEYVVHRALDGFLNEVITEDKKSVAALTDDIRNQVVEELKLDPTKLEGVQVTLYTQIVRRGIDPNLTAEEQAVNPKHWTVRQAVEATPVSEPFELTEDEMRWFPQTWRLVRREQYGRGLVEDHAGSFWTISVLSEALAEGAVTMADVKYLVRPGSMLDVNQLNSSASGTYHYGDPDDVATVNRNMERDFRLVVDVIERYSRHLGEVFLHFPSQIRDAERVTAEENRLRAAALERTHAGVFSHLAQTLQQPLARTYLKQMDITGLQELGVKITIITGFDALSRNQDNENIRVWIDDMKMARELPEQVLQRLQWNNFMQTTAAGRDVDFESLIMSDQELAKKQAAASQADQDAQLNEAQIAGATPQQLAELSQN